MAKTSSEKQRDLRTRREDAGLKRVEIWIPSVSIDAGSRDYADARALQRAIDELVKARPEIKGAAVELLKPILGPHLYDMNRVQD